MIGTEKQTIKDLEILVGTVRHEVGIYLEMAGYQLEDDKALALPFEHDQEDEDRWLAIMGAEERMSNALRSAGREVETEFDDLFRRSIPICSKSVADKIVFAKTVTKPEAAPSCCQRQVVSFMPDTCISIFALTCSVWMGRAMDQRVGASPLI
ncbi:hypothetical protein [Ahrensia marina]|uniref:Uncharacterized protein n=1 Tax=Ahrensia marina TaxID=1514904 RepID=A0A0M9GLN2_9HYPH|nr:hypothetical protein [Ahrensia marina]KPB00663.1 hypothetical protein SU32_12670 [Ahrensia marina]